MRSSLFGPLLLLTGSSLPAAAAKICLMVYQLADNNLEFYIRKDYEELSQSLAVKSGDLRTWVYHDARDSGRGDPLPNTVDRFGNEVHDSFTGSRYMRYDRETGRMKIEKELSGEVNSDMAGTIQRFLEHAMDDCLSDGHEDFFAVFASHAGGFAGYGGDKGTGTRRNLLKINLQINQSIAAAIRAALNSKVGASARLGVLGFDACLMQAAGAADDYQGVAKYLLASEAVEPGHGWAYNDLSVSSSSLNLAKDVLHTFLMGTHGRSLHQSPKTLSILDMDKFPAFVNAFETLCAELLVSMKEGDVALYSFLSRARTSAVAYEGLVDAVGTSNPSGLDIGSFLSQLDRLCNPTALVGISLKGARKAYGDMFLASGVGPGTSAGTGMHITWPHTGEFNENQDIWNQVLFDNEKYRTAIMPRYRALLQWFLVSSKPHSNPQGTSICSVSMASDTTVAVDPNALIVSATAEEDTDTGGFRVETKISADVTQVWVEYGIDLTTPLRPFLRDKGYAPRDDEFLFLLGGDVIGDYNGSIFLADWDQKFYFLNITSSETNEERGFEALYVYDEGDGSKKVPAMYFPDDKREDVAGLGLLDYLFFDPEFWERNGGRFSFLKFSVDEAVGRINNNLNLFVSDEDNGFAEKPREAGGMIIPLIYVDAFIQGQSISTLPGGFNQTVIEWKTDLSYNLLTTHADRVFSVVPSTDAVILNVYAFNHGDPEAKPESRSYDVIRRIKDINDDYLETSPPTWSSSSSIFHRKSPAGGITVLITIGCLVL